MNVVYWICAGLFVLVSAASGLFWVLHFSTGEQVPRDRAVALSRWAVVVLLASFNIWVFKRVIDGIRALF